MKKWTTLLAAATLALGLAACDEKAAPVNKDVVEKSDITLQEVFEKSLKISEELKSVKAVVEMDQEMHLPSEDLNFDSSSQIEMEYIIEPLQMHQKGTTTLISADGEENPMEIEAYMTDDSFYMFEGTAGQWMKFPEAMMGELMSAADQTKPSDQLKMIKDYLKDFTFEQDDNNYILTLEASGEKFTELVQAQANEALQNMAGEVGELDMDLAINSVNYLIHIDKESFQTTKVDVDMDMDMTIDGETMNLKQNVKSDFSSFNEVEKIVIPQEVIDSAVQI